MTAEELFSEFLADLGQFPCEFRHRRIGPAASLAQIEHIERLINASLPKSFRDFLLTETGSIEFDWQFENDALIRLCGEREAIGSGGILFSLKTILQENPQFSSNYEADDYSQAYRPEPLLAFASTPNGDQFAVSLSGKNAGSIRYLSHDIDDIHMYEVATSFTPFVQNYGRLGFVGPEYWIWEQFTNNRTTPIDSSSPHAREFLLALRTGARSSDAEADAARASAAARLATFNVMIRPKAQQFLDAREYEQFARLVDDYTDLLPRAMRARYEYVKKKLR